MSIACVRLEIPDVLLVTPRTFRDARGWFRETWSREACREIGIACDFLQDNQSFSAARATIRGLHFQRPPQAQAKLVRVLRGAIFDVAVDLRRNSPTYGLWCGARLDAEEGAQLFIPRGFAHGFCTLEPGVEVAYKVDAPYAPECDGGLLWNDPDLGVDWPLGGAEPSLSDKDARLPPFRTFDSPF